MSSNRTFQRLVRYVLLLSAPLLILANRSYAGLQSSAPTWKDLPVLEAGKPVERELAGGESHSYLVRLSPGQFCHVVVNQIGIDLVVAFYSAKDEKISEVDSPNYVNGPEPLSLIADESSNYRLEVRSPSKNAAPGRYQLKMDELRASTPRDEKRIVAQKTYSQAKALRDQGTEASMRKALQKYQDALLLWQTLGDRQMEAYQLHEMGVIYGDLGDYQKALDTDTQAIASYKSVGDARGKASVLNNLGYIYGLLGEHEKAISIYQQALKVSQAFNDPNDEPIELANIGAEYAALGQYGKALEIHFQMLAMRRARNNKRGQAITLNNIASCYYSLGEKAKALDYYTQAYVLMPYVGNAFYSATNIHNIGSLYLDQGDRQKAIDYFNQALQLRRTIGDRNGEAATLSQIARLERDRGNLTEARSRIEEALAAVESLRINVKNQSLRTSFLASERRYYEFDIDILMRLHKLHPSAGFDGAALQASEKGRARSLLELLTEAGAEIRKGIDPTLVEREVSLRRSISEKANSQVELLSGKHTEEQAAAAANEIDALATELEQLQAEIRQKSPRYAALTQPLPLSLKEIQSELLDENTVLLEYALGEDDSFVWAVTPTSIHSYELPKRVDIETAARRFYDLITAPSGKQAQGDVEYQTAAAALSRMLLEPIAAELKNKRLLIVSEGLLQFVPFAALPEPLPQPKAAENPSSGPRTAKSNHETGITEATPLIVSHDIVSLPSASVLAVLRRETRERQSPAKTVAVFADPVFDSRDPRIALIKRGLTENSGVSISGEVKRSGEDTSLDSLPRLHFSRQEAEQIVRLASTDKSLAALDFAANRTAAIGSELEKYRVVHFATHGLINNEHVELSGIVLSLVNEEGQRQNGFLRLYDIYNLNLKADLVVLSACKTALGKDIKGEGLVGLTRAFMYAGAPRVVASLWQAEDRSTAVLMSRFYEGMLVDKLSPAAALRKAQISMWKENRWHQPRYWAAFTLQGEWK